MDALKFISIFYQVPLDQKRMPIAIQAGRDTLPHLFRELGYACGAEIGVERGYFSEALCKANPELRLSAIDPWMAYEGYREHVTQRKLEAFRDEALERLAPYPEATVLRLSSIEAAQNIENGRLDFVYIDANHSFMNVAIDISLWSQKVRPGGIVAGHDFKRFRGAYVNCVKDVVQAYAYAHGIRPWFVLKGDRSPSWLWVKP